MEIKGIRKDITFQNSQGIRQTMPALVPAFRSQIEDWQKLPAGKQLKVKVTRPRDAEINLHDQCMAIIHFIYQNFPEYKYKYKTFDLCRKWIYIQIEFVEILEGGGVIYKLPRSVKFDKLDHLEFMEKVYHPVIEHGMKILGMTRDALIEGSIEYGFNRKMHRPKKG